MPVELGRVDEFRRTVQIGQAVQQSAHAGLADHDDDRLVGLHAVAHVRHGDLEEVLGVPVEERPVLQSHEAVPPTALSASDRG
jgi:hypothetical protein